MLPTSGPLRFKTQSTAPEQTSDIGPTDTDPVNGETPSCRYFNPRPSPGLGVQCPVACVQISAGDPLESSTKFRILRKFSHNSTTAFSWLTPFKYGEST